MNANFCRDDSLELLLNDQTDHPEFNSTVAHLSDCTHCQQRLDDLAARPSWWNDTRRHLRHNLRLDIPDLPGTDTLVAAELDTSLVPAIADVQSHLEPPRHPEMLGRIGKYEIECEIGRGGMGIVLKGFDSELNRPVAVKLLAPHLASSGTARQRFVREARAAAAVVYENVVAIHGIETDGSLPSIIMEYISGLSLQQHIKQHGAFDAVDVVRIGIQIASGLAAAHGQGLVHRDIKPANIILENGINRVQITDFGLARAAHDADLTRTGVIAGTPAFMSPEQSLSETIDCRSDLFSLGSVLYYAATGRLPFRASTPIGVLQQVCNGTPTRPREENSEIPDHLEAVIEKLLAKNPDERFATALNVQRYLTEYLAHLQQPTTTHPPSKLATPSSRRCMRRIWKRAGIAVGLPLVAMTWFFWPTPPEPAIAPVFQSQHEPPSATTRHYQIAAAVASVASMSDIDAEIMAIDHETSTIEQMNSAESIPVDTLDLSLQLLMTDTTVAEMSFPLLSVTGETDQERVTPTEVDAINADLQQLEQSIDQE